MSLQYFQSLTNAPGAPPHSPLVFLSGSLEQNHSPQQNHEREKLKNHRPQFYQLRMVQNRRDGNAPHGGEARQKLRCVHPVSFSRHRDEVRRAPSSEKQAGHWYHNVHQRGKHWPPIVVQRAAQYLHQDAHREHKRQSSEHSQGHPHRSRVSSGRQARPVLFLSACSESSTARRLDAPLATELPAATIAADDQLASVTGGHLPLAAPATTIFLAAQFAFSLEEGRLPRTRTPAKAHIYMYGVFNDQRYTADPALYSML